MRRQEVPFTGTGGINLFCQRWLPDAPPQAMVAIVHGVAEHSGRYANLVNSLTANQYGAWGFDLRGHGRSGGRRGHIHNWQEYRADLGCFLTLIQKEMPQHPIFLFGHSMGALIVLDFLLHEPARVGGAIVAGTPIEPVGVAKPYLVALAHLLSRLWPACPLPSNLDTTALSRDTAVVQAYESDPLVLRRMTARWGTEALAVVERVKENAERITLPLLVLHGKADTLNSAIGAQAFYDAVGSEDKEIRLYENGRHELHNDLDHEKVMADILDWLARRL